MSFRPRGEIFAVQWLFNERRRRFLLVPRRNDSQLENLQKYQFYSVLSIDLPEVNSCKLVLKRA